MKRMFIMGALALIVLLALPGAAMAADSQTVTVTGSIGGYITVSLTDTALGWETMVVGDNTDSTTLTVSSSFANWGVDVSANNAGYMVDATPEPDALLGSPLGISNDGGTSYNTLSSTWTDFFSGTPGTGQTESVDVKQTISESDSSGTYSITITFQGGAN